MKFKDNITKHLIPEASVKRLILYKRCLERMNDEGIKTVLSDDIGNKCGINSSVIRKDFSYFGDFGTRGKGYEVSTLINGLDKFIFLKTPIKLILVGAGKLGQAIINHSDENCRVKFEAAFDMDPKKIGTKIRDTSIYSPDDMKEYIKKNKVKIAVVAIPCTDAREVINTLVESGIKSILSLALVPVKVPDDVEISFMDVLPEVEFLHFKLKQRSII